MFPVRGLFTASTGLPAELYPQIREIVMLIFVFPIQGSFTASTGLPAELYPHTAPAIADSFRIITANWRFVKRFFKLSGVLRFSNFRVFVLSIFRGVISNFSRSFGFQAFRRFMGKLCPFFALCMMRDPSRSPNTLSHESAPADHSVGALMLEVFYRYECG